MQRGALAEDLDQLVGVHRRDLTHVEAAEALLQVVWTPERLFHLHLLIENKADQQGEGIGLEELVRLRYIGPYDRHN